MESYEHTRSEYCERLIRLDGMPFNLKDNYSFLIDAYDIGVEDFLLKSGRQVAKTTTLCNILLTEMIGTPFFKSLYVSPTNLQTRRFSNQRLATTIKHSPLINKYFTDSSTVQNVFEKTFTNGSYINLTHAFLGADSLRGISADRLCIDELQDILWNTMAVINETLSASPYQWVMYAGTPKTFDNPMEKLWDASSQCVWWTRCTGCNHDNVPGMDNIGKTGYVCSKCGKAIDVRTGAWRALRSGASRVALHIPQIIRPNLNWPKLLIKMDEYPEGRFRNEVLGEPYDLGLKPITMAELIACCGDYGPVLKKSRELGIDHMFAGMDWAGASGFSVFVVGGMTADSKFKVVYAKKYSNTDPRAIIDDVVKLCQDFNVEYLGADRGEGYTNNRFLMEKAKWTKVVEFAYQAVLKAGVKWHRESRCFHADRTVVLDATFYKIKKEQVMFPTYESFGRYFFPDIMGVFSEYNEYLKKIKYDHPPAIPDDFLHALTYMLQAFEMSRKLAGH